jgi:hypothetical protein
MELQAQEDAISEDFNGIKYLTNQISIWFADD